MALLEWLASRERDLDPVDVDRAALVRVVRPVRLDALRSRASRAARPCATTGQPNFLRERDRVADVVVVPVRDEDRVDPLGLLLVVRALRVPVQERIDVDALAARGVDAEGRVPEPGECRSHVQILRKRSRVRGPSGRGGEHRAHDALRLASVVLVLGAALADAAGAPLARLLRARRRRSGGGASLRSRALGDVLDGTAAEPHDRVHRRALRPLALPSRPARDGRPGAAHRRTGRRRRSGSRLSSPPRGLRRAGAARGDVAAAPRTRAAAVRARRVASTDCYLARTGRRRRGVARQVDQRLDEEERADRDDHRQRRPRSGAAARAAASRPRSPAAAPPPGRMYIARITPR